MSTRFTKIYAVIYTVVFTINSYSYVFYIFSINFQFTFDTRYLRLLSSKFHVFEVYTHLRLSLFLGLINQCVNSTLSTIVYNNKHT